MYYLSLLVMGKERKLITNGPIFFQHPMHEESIGFYAQLSKDAVKQRSSNIDRIMKEHNRPGFIQRVINIVFRPFRS